MPGRAGCCHFIGLLGKARHDVEPPAPSWTARDRARDGALDLGVKWLTVYAFSTENWRRPVDEVRYLMGFNESILTRRRDELNERGVRIKVGSDVYDGSIQARLAALQESF